MVWRAWRNDFKTILLSPLTAETIERAAEILEAAAWGLHRPEGR
jgi:hypothetical protein